MIPADGIPYNYTCLKWNISPVALEILPYYIFWLSKHNNQSYIVKSMKAGSLRTEQIIF